MQSIRKMCAVIACAALFGACVDQADTGEVTQLTVGSGAVATTLANVTLGEGELEIKWNNFVAKVEGPTSVITQEVVIQPGGHTGWHSHPGPVIVSVATGAMTLYYASNPCSGATYPAGTGFVDPGGANTHIARNLSDVAATLRVQYYIPTGTAPRIDQPAPAGAAGC